MSTALARRPADECPTISLDLDEFFKVNAVPVKNDIFESNALKEKIEKLVTGE
jgi:hypothetical protein